MSDTSQNGHKDGLTNKIIMSSVLIALFIPGKLILFQKTIVYANLMLRDHITCNSHS